MAGIRPPIAITALCALIVGAIAAGNASAAQRGVTCAPTGTGFSEAHCVTATPGSGSFSHVNIANGVATGLTGSNENTAVETTTFSVLKLKGTLVGIATEISCLNAWGTGELTNAASSVSATSTFEFSTCVVLLPIAKNCVVKEPIVTEKLAATTVGQAAGNVKISAAGATNIANITLEECEIKALNQSWPLTGSFTATATGATLTTTEAAVTTQNTLKWGGVKAGLEGALTISMSGEGANPITLT
ncbi:MAG TPA: hypothetical protein VFJ57_05905 [Solirubrobacterales bacterium]|nr:hypothetical protein [Solirubrobacterales bacterium]